MGSAHARALRARVELRYYLLALSVYKNITWIVCQKKTCTDYFSDWHSSAVRSRVVCWFLYSREPFFMVCSDWISSVIDLVVPKSNCLEKNRFKTRKLTLYFAIPLTSFSSLPSAVAVILVVFRSCSAHVFPAQGFHLNHRPTIRI